MSLQRRIIEHRTTIEVVAQCEVNDTPYSVICNRRKFLAWRKDGGRVQDVFPELTPEQREFLLTGITPAEWKAIQRGTNHSAPIEV